MTTVKKLAENIDQVRSNPLAIQRTVLNTLQQLSDGEDYELTDPSNPFVFLTEAAVAGAYNSFERAHSLHRHAYPSLAQSFQELYSHISDYEYTDVFAKPGEATFTLLLSLDEIYNRLIDSGQFTRKITIPAGTEFEVEGYVFTLLYSIDIRESAYSTLQVFYQTEPRSPIQLLETNEPDWEIVTMPPHASTKALDKILRIDFPVKQVRIQQFEQKIKTSTGYSDFIGLEEDFHFIRVFIRKTNGGWQELHISHSRYVYNPDTPTALVEVYDDGVGVEIPRIYFSKSIDETTVRVDVYTTQGDVVKDLSRYEPNAFTARWRSIVADSVFFEPIRNFSTLTLFCDDVLKHGRQSLGFQELKQRVVNNSLNPHEIPITLTQIQNVVEDLGYRIKTMIDHVTNRIYLATRKPLEPENTDFTSRASLGINTLVTRIDDLIDNQQVIDHGERITIRSGSVFELTDQGLDLVRSDTVEGIEQMDQDKRSIYVNNRNLYYLPFDYVLDFSQRSVELRAYYLDNHRVKRRYFLERNPTSVIQIATDRYHIERVENGYRLTVRTNADDVIKKLDDGQIHAQLSTIPKNWQSRERVFMHASERRRDPETGAFEFDFFFETNFNIDPLNRLLYINSFYIDPFDQHIYPVYLDNSFDLVYVITDRDNTNNNTTHLDRTYKANFLIEQQEGDFDSSFVLSHEQLDILFGESLDKLWLRSRGIADSARDFERYQADVYDTYDETVYQRDPETGAINLTYDEQTGEVEYTVVHEKGDLKYDEQGQPLLKHEKGEIKTDSDGQPITLGPRVMRYEIDLLLIEAGFYFAKEQRTKAYIQDVIRQMVRWINEDIDGLHDRLLENTQIHFHPETTIGWVQAFIGDGQQIEIWADQSLQVDVYVSQQTYNDNQLLEQIRSDVVQTINEAFNSKQISTTHISYELINRYQDYIYELGIYGLGVEDYEQDSYINQSGYRIISIPDETSQLSIRKRLTVTPDRQLGLEDAVDVRFIEHSFSS